jgi:transcription elongation factor Elf1
METSESNAVDNPNKKLFSSSKNGFVIAIIGLVFLCGICGLSFMFVVEDGMKTADRTSEVAEKQETEEQKQEVIEQKQDTVEQELDTIEQELEKQEDTTLTHDRLLEISNSNPKSVIGKTYDMTLYLEQRPSNTQAEFMTQSDDNSMDTILITCNMQSSELNGLDGDSAMNRIYKPYDIELVFREYNGDFGHYYKSDCVLKD